MDENPLDYWIEINGVFFESGEVHDREIEFNLPYLSIGDYTVTIMVIDPLGHSASDVVIVQVTEVPLSYLISVMSFSGYVSFLTTMVIGLSAFIISDMTRGLTLRLTLLLKKYYNKYWQKEE
jgi:hypothetical protein